jgi:hypothetical protein
MSWTLVTFGKHRGKTLPKIIFDDPDWFFWALNAGAFRGRLLEEAERLAERATRIKIPQDGEERRVAQYVLYPDTYQFVRLELVEESRPWHTGSSRTFREDHISLSVAYDLTVYDKSGCKKLVSDVKAILFGSRNVRMTRERAEAFFDNDDNFDLAWCGGTS